MDDDTIPELGSTERGPRMRQALPLRAGFRPADYTWQPAIVSLKTLHISFLCVCVWWGEILPACLVCIWGIWGSGLWDESGLGAKSFLFVPTSEPALELCLRNCPRTQLPLLWSCSLKCPNQLTRWLRGRNERVILNEADGRCHLQKYIDCDFWRLED